MSFQSILQNSKELQLRVKATKDKLGIIRQKFKEEAQDISERRTTVFCAGSIARQDSGNKSDLDLFVIADEKLSQLDEAKFFTVLININEKLGYPEFSNNGEFLKIYQLNDLKTLTGTREEDSQNIFTARMLLLLESQAVCNQDLYEVFLKEVVKHYCRDEANHDMAFRPLFLLNDLLRYWRTLCLNYERIRHDAKKPWRKKNVNLKFSRMLTVFGTVLPLITLEHTNQDILKLCAHSPLERLAQGLDSLGAPELLDDFPKFLENYEYFLRLKEAEKIKDDLAEKEKSILDEKANQFSLFLYKALMHPSVSNEYRRYLVI